MLYYIGDVILTYAYKEEVMKYKYVLVFLGGEFSLCYIT
jgi:hypothetical protein